MTVKRNELFDKFDKFFLNVSVEKLPDSFVDASKFFQDDLVDLYYELLDGEDKAELAQHVFNVRALDILVDGTVQELHDLRTDIQIDVFRNLRAHVAKGYNEYVRHLKDFVEEGYAVMAGAK